jgi:NAD(P)H-hydrate epimerase
VHEVRAASSLPGELVVDALFGAGLDRPLSTDLAALIDQIVAGRRHVVAVDVPSGIDGSTGDVSAGTAAAGLTVTFCCLKPAHLLQPARSLMGEIICADIGIPAAIVAAHDEGLRVNSPAEWLSWLPSRRVTTHKYSFGHALVLGGGVARTGASGMAALAAARIGAGLVTVAAPRDALSDYAAHGQSLMTRSLDRPNDLRRLLEDDRFNAVLLGPAAGLGRRTCLLLARLLDARRPTVLDADALSLLVDVSSMQSGRSIPHEKCVLTPHDGEFKRICDAEGDRLRRARAAAQMYQCTVLLKGADTVIAAADGRARINPTAPGNLATAGTGDVLAGMVTGLLAQGLDPFDAASAAAWLHAEAARHCPTPMLAVDLLPFLPDALRDAEAAASGSAENVATGRRNA